MISILLSIIYVAFISLGLPDSLLGAAWPTMVSEFTVPLSYAGIISTIISAGTVVSSLASDKVTHKLGTGLVTAISVLLTGGALLGFSLSSSFGALCVFAVPYGVGAGAIDAALNNFVALHYSSKHMSWLHCFWGVGATISPYIMSYAISADKGWRTGYGIVSVIQLVFTAVLFLSLPIWNKQKQNEKQEEINESPIGIRQAVKIKGVKAILLSFFSYCAFEATAGLWASTYLVNARGIDSETAAAFASMFYIGITGGRFFMGFIADKIGDKYMIRVGLCLMSVGALMIALPLSSSAALPAPGGASR